MASNDTDIFTETAKEGGRRLLGTHRGFYWGAVVILGGGVGTAGGSLAGGAWWGLAGGVIGSLALMALAPFYFRIIAVVQQRDFAREQLALHRTQSLAQKLAATKRLRVECGISPIAKPALIHDGRSGRMIPDDKGWHFRVRALTLRVLDAAHRADVSINLLVYIAGSDEPVRVPLHWLGSGPANIPWAMNEASVGHDAPFQSEWIGTHTEGELGMLENICAYSLEVIDSGRAEPETATFGLPGAIAF
jgi:hypothetical protein